MRTRISLLLFLALFVLFGVSCGTVESDEYPDKQKVQEIETEISEEIAVTKTEYGTETVALEGNTLEGLTVIGTEDAFYCNLEENMKVNRAERVPGLVCKEPLYDITYFVNYGRDDYIYAGRGEKTELAVKIPAKDLYCRGGELYFIADSYEKYRFSGFEEGNVLKYNPKDGSVSIVLNCNADAMIVYQDGICYEELGEMKNSGGLQSRTEERFFYSFALGESSPFPKDVSSLRRWKDAFFQIQMGVRAMSESNPLQQLTALGYTVAGVGGVDGMNLVDAQGTVRKTLQNVMDFPEEYWVSGDSVYYVEQRKEEEDAEKRSVFRRYDIQTGTHEDIVKLEYPTMLSLSDLLYYKGSLYFSNGLRVDTGSLEQCYLQKEDGAIPRFDFFYTDGENCFCVSNGRLWRFLERRGVAVGEQEFVPGVPLAIGTYVYSLEEPVKQ